MNTNRKKYIILSPYMKYYYHHHHHHHHQLHFLIFAGNKENKPYFFRF